MRKRLLPFLLAGLFLTACRDKNNLPTSAEVAFNDSVPSLDSLPEQAFPDMDTVLRSRAGSGDTIPGSADALKSALPNTLAGFGEADMTEAQMLEGAEGHMAMASALFFDEEDHFLEMKIYDISASHSLVKALAETYKAADGTRISEGFYSRIPLQQPDRFAFLSSGGENALATCVVRYRYQLTIETDAKCDAACFTEIISAVKWSALK